MELFSWIFRLKNFGFIFPFSLFVYIACVVFMTGHELLINQYLTGDGLHYYSAIRNFVKYLSFWEGPTFEYLLGNHSYISMYFFLSPLYLIFPDPVLVTHVNIATHVIAALLVVRCSTLMLHKRSFLAWSLGLIYLVLPTVVNGYFASFDTFQPDFFVAPLLMLVFLFAITDRPKLFLFGTALVILTKEEFIVLFPFCALLILHCKWLLQGRWVVGKDEKHPSKSRFFCTSYLFTLFALFSAY